MVKLSDEGEIHPAALVTVNVNDPLGIEVTVSVMPLPGVVTPPGVRVKSQLPVAGNPLRATLPVEIVHFGSVMAPITGTPGA